MRTGLLTALENPSLKRNHRGWVTALLWQPGLLTVSVIIKKISVANLTAYKQTYISPRIIGQLSTACISYI